MPDPETQQQIDAYVKSLTTWEAEQRAIVQSQIDTPSPNDIIERRADLRDSGMEPDQLDGAIRRQTSEPQRGEWYRQTQAEHNLDLGLPQRFPLTGDGLVSQRIIADGPFNGPDIGAELTLARYRDWQHQQNQKEEQPKEEQTRVRSLSI